MSTIGNADVTATAETRKAYRAPSVLEIGKAVDLLQGYQGKHTDGSSGYYWDEEG